MLTQTKDNRLALVTGVIVLSVQIDTVTAEN